MTNPHKLFRMAAFMAYILPKIVSPEVYSLSIKYCNGALSYDELKTLLKPKQPQPQGCGYGCSETERKLLECGPKQL